jgi:hypothetical protein
MDDKKKRKNIITAKLCKVLSNLKWYDKDGGCDESDDVLKTKFKYVY